MTTEAPDPNGLPLLTFELARSIGEFPEFELDLGASELQEYSRVTGSSLPAGGVVPPGYAAIFGRLGYLRQHRMPGGGVLLGQEITWLAPASVGEPLVIRSVVESAEEDEVGRRKIVFETTARQHGTTVAVVRITAGWPR